MNEQATVEVLPLQAGYDYGRLDGATAAVVRAATTRINERIKRSLANIIAMGQDPWRAPRYAQDSLRKKLKVIGLDMEFPVPPVPPPPF